MYFRDSETRVKSRGLDLGISWGLGLKELAE